MAISRQFIYTGCFFLNTVYIVSKKGSHLMFDNNFGRCGPIFKILSPIDSWIFDFHKVVYQHIAGEVEISVVRT